jgi:hypothetical protein
MRITKSKSFYSCCNAKTDQIVELAKYPAKQSLDITKDTNCQFLYIFFLLSQASISRKYQISQQRYKEEKKRERSKV